MASLSIQVEVARAQPAANERARLVVALEYSAPPACPNEAQFRERAERSSARLRWGVPAQGSRAYRVLIDASTGGFQGQLYEAGKAIPRALEAGACEELVDALSLMLALSAEATLAGAAAPVAESEALAAVPEQEPPAPAQPPTPAQPPPAAPIALAKVARRPIQTEHVPRPNLLSVSAFALLNAAPDTLFGLAFNYERALQRVVSLRLEARAALGQARARETYGGVAPAVCVRLESSLAELVGCGGLMLGYLDVSGVEYSYEQSPYCLAPLLGVRLRRTIGDRLAIELGAELEHALIKRSYTVKRDQSTFETPALSEALQLGVGARF